VRPFLLLAFAPLLLAQPARAADFTIPAVIAFDGSAPIEADIAGRLSGQVTDGKLVVHAQDQHGGRKLDYSLDGAGVPTAAVDVTASSTPIAPIRASCPAPA
jgi:hypothetical protein